MAISTIPVPMEFSDTTTSTKSYPFPANSRALICVTAVVSSNQQLGLYHFAVNSSGNTGYLVKIFETSTLTAFTVSASGAQFVVTRNAGTLVVNSYRSS